MNPTEDCIHLYYGNAATPLAEKAARFVHERYAEILSFERNEQRYDTNGLLLKPTSLPPVDVMARAQRRNPFSLVIVCSPKDIIRGVVELWRLKEHVLRELCSGDINETDLKDEDFTDSGDDGNSIYVAITVQTGGRFALYQKEVHFTVCCLAGTLDILTQTQPLRPEPFRLYALQASDQGGDLMSHFPFVRLPISRKDGQNVWQLLCNIPMLEKKKEEWKEYLKKKKVQLAIVQHMHDGQL